MGHVPRIMTVIARGSVSKQWIPGDLVTISGVFCPAPFTGFRGMMAGLIQDMYIEASAISRDKKKFL